MGKCGNVCFTNAYVMNSSPSPLNGNHGLVLVQAIALGADAVMLGRPILYGLALQGEHGVRKVLQMLKRELLLAMQLAGCTSLAAITPGLVLPFGANMQYPGISKM